MGLIVYISKTNESGKRLQRMIGQLIWQDTIEIFYTFKRLEFRLRHSAGNEDIALLLAATPEDLNELVADQQVLNNLRIILILPDGEKGTIAKGHLLRPRFVAYQDGNFSDVASVLRKMSKARASDPHLTRSSDGLPDSENITTKL
jgi:hypothetical protein